MPELQPGPFLEVAVSSPRRTFLLPMQPIQDFTHSRQHGSIQFGEGQRQLPEVLLRKSLPGLGRAVDPVKLEQIMRDRKSVRRPRGCRLSGASRQTLLQRTFHPPLASPAVSSRVPSISNRMTCTGTAFAEFWGRMISTSRENNERTERQTGNITGESGMLQSRPGDTPRNSTTARAGNGETTDSTAGRRNGGQRGKTPLRSLKRDPQSAPPPPVHPSNCSLAGIRKSRKGTETRPFRPTSPPCPAGSTHARPATR